MVFGFLFMHQNDRISTYYIGGDSGMKMYAFKCPQCGGNLEADEERDFIFCQFCGTKIQMNKIDKSELRIKEMEHEERMKDKEIEAEKHENRTQLLIAAGVLFIMAIMLFFAFTSK